MPPVLIGVDLGGTSIKCGVIDAEGAVTHVTTVATEADRGYPHVLGRISELVRSRLHIAGAGPQDAVVGVGVPGPMSPVDGVVRGAPNLPGWVNVPVREDLSRTTGARVWVENDANAAAYGEFTAWAPGGVRDLCVLTLGTGVGGGIIADGRLLRGHFGSAGEIGHLIVETDGRACPCGQRGCLERYASAAALISDFESLAEASLGPDRDGSAVRRVLSGEHLTASQVCHAAQHDQVARAAFDRACTALAIGCVALQHLLNPQVIVLAGGMTHAGAMLTDAVQKRVDELTWRIDNDQPKIALPRVAGEVGVLGAAQLAVRQFTS